MVKGKNAMDAINQLEAVAKRSSPSVGKLLRSAMANAENNHDMIKENLYIKSIKVDEGVKLKRFRPKGFGRVSPIEKKTSRISLVLAEKVPGMKRAIQAEKKDKAEIKEPPVSTKEKQFRQDKPFGATQGKPEIKTELGKKEGIFGNIGKKIFRRKAI